MEILQQIGIGLIEPFVLPFVPRERLYWGYLASALLLAVLVVARSDSQGQSLWARLFPKAVFWHPSAKADYLFAPINVALWGAILAPMMLAAPKLAAAVTELLTSQLGAPPVTLPASGALDGAVTILAFLTADFCIFLAHYLQHKISLLWEFHKVHHSAQVLTPVTVHRVHPVDDILTSILAGLGLGTLHGVVGWLAPSGYAVITAGSLNLGFFLFFLLGINLRHSHVWLSYGPKVELFLISPAQHQLHHSAEERHFDKNMGYALAIWDRMFGTLYVPQGLETPRLGLADFEDRAYDSIKALYFLPFKKAAQRLRLGRWLAPALLLALYGAAMPAYAQSIFLEDMTWPEVRTAISKGKIAAIIPTGGTEQGGAHLALGKHNVIVRHTANRIAAALGDTLVAPVLAYVPEGDIDPPTQNMRFPGTISVNAETFAAVLEQAARSLLAQGFSEVYFLGDHGLSQAPQEQAAEKLDRAFIKRGKRVFQIADYYFANGQTALLQANGMTDAQIGSHAAVRDTSELLALAPSLTRPDKISQNGPAWGGNGDPARASADLGEKLLTLKIDAALKEIKRKRGR